MNFSEVCPYEFIKMNNNLEIEHTECPLCNSKKKEKVYENFDTFQVVRCKTCKFYYLSPRLSKALMIKLYREDSYYEDGHTGYESYLKQEQALRATFRRFIFNLSRRNLTGGNLLEVGCGYGFFLDEVRDFFKTREGTEFSRAAHDHACMVADNIYHGGIDQIPQDRKYDCIVAIHVIEHIYEPKDFLDKLYKRLKPGGKMVVATPNMGSLWRRFMGHRWPSFKIPEHILYFDKKSLQTAMQMVGLMNIKLLPYPHAFPLSLIAEKLHIPFKSFLGNMTVWLPATTLAMYGVKPDSDAVGK